MIPLDGLLDRSFLDLASSGDAALPFSAVDLVTRLVVPVMRSLPRLFS